MHCELVCLTTLFQLQWQNTAWDETVYKVQSLKDRGSGNGSGSHFSTSTNSKRCTTHCPSAFKQNTILYCTMWPCRLTPFWAYFVGPQDKANCTCEMTAWSRSTYATPRYHVPVAVYTYSPITWKLKPKSYTSSQWPLKAQGVKMKSNTNVIRTKEFVV